MIFIFFPYLWLNFNLLSMAVPTTIKLYVNISDNIKHYLFSYIDKNYPHFPSFSKFMMTYATHFYDNLPHSIPSTEHRQRLLHKFIWGNRVLNNLTFYIPTHIEGDFLHNRHLNFRNQKVEATYLIFCLYTSFYFNYTLNLE